MGAVRQKQADAQRQSEVRNRIERMESQGTLGNGAPSQDAAGLWEKVVNRFTNSNRSGVSKSIAILMQTVRQT